MCAESYLLKFPENVALFFVVVVVFFFNDTATTEIYTLSLHDALPIYDKNSNRFGLTEFAPKRDDGGFWIMVDKLLFISAHHLGHDNGLPVFYVDIRSEEHTSELQSQFRISYAVFCLKKKKNKHLKHISVAHILTTHTSHH